MKILFVENHRAFAETVVREFLGQHQVVIVPSLADARLRAGAETFDVALVDYDLEDGTGDALVRELLATGFAGRVVAVSSHEAGNAALVAAGAHAVCAKTRFGSIEAVLGGTGRV